MNDEGRAVRHIRLMTDWSLPPVYIGTGDGLLDLTEPDELVDLFGVPDEVVDAIEDWYAKLQTVINLNTPSDTEWERLPGTGFYEAGRCAATLLRRYLPTEVVIEYRGNDDIPPEYY